jgi:acetylornithine deacetylase/succinyl-diaminopimelate desuccinylase-like protein
VHVMAFAGDDPAVIWGPGGGASHQHAEHMH